MAELSKNIANHLFGDITTNELTENAYSIKKQEFGTNISFSPKVFIPLTTYVRIRAAIVLLLNLQTKVEHI